MRALTFIRDIVKMLDVQPDKVRVSVFAFSHHTEEHITFNSYSDKSDLLAKIMQTRYIGWSTNTARAIDDLRNYQLIHRRWKLAACKYVGVVITDGKSRAPDETREAAYKAKNIAGIDMWAVGVGSSVDAKELDNIATKKFWALNSTSYTNLQYMAAHVRCRIFNETKTKDPNNLYSDKNRKDDYVECS